MGIKGDMYFIWICLVCSLSSILFPMVCSVSTEEIYRSSELVCCLGNYTFPKLRIDFLDPPNFEGRSVNNEGITYTLDCSPENYGFYSIMDGMSNKLIFLAGDKDGDCSKMFQIRLEYMKNNLSCIPHWLYDEIFRNAGNQISSSTHPDEHPANQIPPTAINSKSLMPNDSSSIGCNMQIFTAIIGTASTFVIGIISFVLWRY